MRRKQWIIVIGTGLLAAGSACAPDTFPNSLTVTTPDVDRIVNDNGLTSQEKRDELGELGVPPEVINSVLRAVRTGNQFGGDLRTAFDKVREQRFTALTPDEIQIFGDAASDEDAGLNVSLGDDEAQAVADLFAAENINTPNDLNLFLADPANEVPATIPDGTLRELFIDFDFNTLIDNLP